MAPLKFYRFFIASKPVCRRLGYRVKRLSDLKFLSVMYLLSHIDNLRINHIVFCVTRTIVDAENGISSEVGHDPALVTDSGPSIQINIFLSYIAHTVNKHMDVLNISHGVVFIHSLTFLCASAANPDFAALLLAISTI